MDLYGSYGSSPTIMSSLLGGDGLTLTFWVSLTRSAGRSLWRCWRCSRPLTSLWSCGGRLRGGCWSRGATACRCAPWRLSSASWTMVICCACSWGAPLRRAGWYSAPWLKILNTFPLWDHCSVCRRAALCSFLCWAPGFLWEWTLWRSKTSRQMRVDAQREVPNRRNPMMISIKGNYMWLYGFIKTSCFP